jgi:hypothetical protein
MDIAQAVSGYITKMMSVGDSTSGTQDAKMKVLLLDRDTVGFVGYPLRCVPRSYCQGSNCIHRYYSIRPPEP